MSPAAKNPMLASMLAIAVRFRAIMRETIGSVRAPRNIKEAIHIGSPQPTNTGASIEITIPLKEAPAAAAFEWGSGEHREDEEKGEYEIKPKRPEDLMIFPKEDWPGYEPPPDAPDLFMFKKVMHPGVAARPYIAPSIEKMMPEAVKLLGDSVLAMVSVTGGKGREVVIIGGKKK